MRTSTKQAIAVLVIGTIIGVGAVYLPQYWSAYKLERMRAVRSDTIKALGYTIPPDMRHAMAHVFWRGDDPERLKNKAAATA